MGRPLPVLVNITLMEIYDAPILSKVSMTTLQENKFWRKFMIQLSKE